MNVLLPRNMKCKECGERAAMVGHVPEMPKPTGDFIIDGARELLRRGLTSSYDLDRRELPVSILDADTPECEEAGCEFYCRTHGLYERENQNE